MPAPTPDALALAERYRLALAHEPRRGAAGERLGRAAGSSLEFQDRRTYQAGDDVRHLDWRAFARTDQLLVRQYREEVLLRAEILVDVSRSMAVEAEKGQRAVDLVALLHLAARATGYEVATITLGDIPERFSEERLLRDGPSFDARSPLGAAVHDAAPRLRPGSLRIVVSDFLSPHDATTLVRTLAHGAGSLVLLQLLGQGDADPPVDAALRLIDAESDTELDLVIDASRRARYLDRLGRLTSALETEARRAGALFLSTTSAIGLEETCRDLLARRGVLEPV